MASGWVAKPLRDIWLALNLIAWHLDGSQGLCETSGWLSTSLHGIWMGLKVFARPLLVFKSHCTAPRWLTTPFAHPFPPPPPFQVNGLLVDLPFRHSPQLYAYTSGIHAFLQTDFGLVVTFDWHSYARLILPTTYASSVCGLCGNADGDPDDDFKTPDGRSAADENDFGDSWKVADVPGCDSSCVGDCGVCGEAEKRGYRGDKHCGLLVKQGGPFAGCHGVIDPKPYFEDCLFDACLYKGHQEVVCTAVGAYVTACQSRGVSIEAWRTAAFCSELGVLGGGLGCVEGGMGGGLEGGCMRVWGASRLHRRGLVCLEGWGLHAWGLLGGFGVCMHEGPAVCLQDLGLACMEGFGFAWRGLHACVGCFQVAQKGFGLPAGFGVCMHGSFEFAWRFWGLHAWKGLDLLGGFGMGLLGGLGFACMKDLGFACRIWGLHAWRFWGLHA